jgi:colanic acid biosynthesis glycosyl transferase WcaI
MRRFDRVSSISPRMMRKLLRKGVDRSRIGYFPNWVDTALIKPIARENSLRQELGIPANTAVCLYSGNMGEKQGLEVLVDVARKFVGSRSPLFLVCGDGAAKARTIAAATGLDNIRFLPLQPLRRLNELLGLADIHLLPQRIDAEDLVMPSKLTAILASGRPVVASARPGSDVAHAAGAGGLIVPPGDVTAFAAALQRLLEDDSLRTALGQSGRAFAIANLDRETVLRNAKLQLDALIGEASWSTTEPSYG